MISAQFCVIVFPEVCFPDFLRSQTNDTSCVDSASCQTVIILFIFRADGQTIVFLGKLL